MGDGRTSDRGGTEPHDANLDHKVEPEVRRMDLSLWWVLPAREEAALGQSVLQALSVVAEARPRVFGVVEPPRQELAPDNDEPFLVSWREEAARDAGGMLIWKARTPFRDGWVSFPYRDEETDGPLQGREKVVGLEVRVRPKGYVEPERREALVEFFAEVADRLGAVYASAGLDSQEQPEVGNDAAHMGNIRGVWLGIPPFRTWLHWFGKPYVPELANLDGVVKSGQGLLLRRGEQPPLKGEHPGPSIPARLCWRGQTREEWRAEDDRDLAERRAFQAQLAAAIGRGEPHPEPPPPQPYTARSPAELVPEIGASPTHRLSLPSNGRSRGASKTSGPRLLWKDETGPGWPGAGHPEREGPAYLERPDGSLEELNDGEWLKRADAQRIARENNYAFEEV
jgi:hypothetical protein